MCVTTISYFLCGRRLAPQTTPCAHWRAKGPQQRAQPCPFSTTNYVNSNQWCGGHCSQRTGTIQNPS
ncbi:hypothetical protein K435DRAFT_779228, partial [Dendrothele bispora CBS 962.96]